MSFTTYDIVLLLVIAKCFNFCEPLEGKLGPQEGDVSRHFLYGHIITYYFLLV